MNNIYSVQHLALIEEVAKHYKYVYVTFATGFNHIPFKNVAQPPKGIYSQDLNSGHSLQAITLNLGTTDSTYGPIDAQTGDILYSCVFNGQRFPGNITNGGIMSISGSHDQKDWVHFDIATGVNEMLQAILFDAVQKETKQPKRQAWKPTVIKGGKDEN